MFCSGADLKERKGLSEEDTEILVMGLRNTFQRWYKLAMPTLALIDGPALGGGLELALACDIRVATVNSILALPETGLAIIPGAVSLFLYTRLVGRYTKTPKINRSSQGQRANIHWIQNNPLKSIRDWANQLFRE